MNDASSIFFCEAYAILVAVKEIISSNHSKTIIYSDSKSVLEALLNDDNREPIIRNIRTYLVEALDTNKEIILTWIPLHINIEGNDKVDKLAREAASSILEPSISMSSHDLKKHIIKKIKVLWNNQWLRNPPLKLHSIRENLYTGKASTMATRKKQVVLTRIRIGHTNLTHIHLITKETQNKCSTCNTPITIPHIFTECRGLQRLRIVNDIKTNFKDNFTESAQADKVIKFLNDAKLINKI